MEEPQQKRLDLELRSDVEAVELGGAYTLSENSMLLEFRGETLEDAVAVWHRLDEYETPVQWRRAAVASWVRANSEYGDQALQKFGEMVGVAYPTVRYYASVYDRVVGLETDLQVSLSKLEGLTFTHYRIGNYALKDDHEFVEALAEAHDNGWTAGKFGNVLAQRQQLQRGEATPELVPGEARYPALSMLNATEEQINEMARRLDDMDPSEREQTLEKVKSFDVQTIADLAGVPYREVEVDESLEAAKGWDRMWRNLNGLMLSVRARGGVAGLTNGWTREQREALRQSIAKVREDLEAWERELM